MDKEWNISDVYEDISNKLLMIPEEWCDCPICFVKPRLWIFDNGCYAKCKCNEMYGEASASGMSIMEYGRLHNFNFSGYDSSHSDLRDNWNKVVNNRKRKIKIGRLFEVKTLDII